MPPELWIIITHFTTAVTSSPPQLIGRDYHILLPHNGAIMTNERAQCAALLPRSPFPPLSRQYLQAGGSTKGLSLWVLTGLHWGRIRKRKRLQSSGLKWRGGGGKAGKQKSGGDASPENDGLTVKNNGERKRKRRGCLAGGKEKKKTGEIRTHAGSKLLSPL